MVEIEFFEIIGTSLGACQEKGSEAVPWYCLEGRERTAGGLLGICMVPEMDD